ncbi:hypothetical protein [Terribacillus saccharophilus]|uniref:Type II secretory pathway, pseudopilin PulG n=1 Tax=Terribacillus saccharophilus TaxID=361277 RepID=A0ABX4H139_9BACI|nr:hypothetical protein [Terribacillus saccharophilus]PAD36431.1 hypothetical protein CHH56_04305 [Terribacillus saccharophilus]PAD97095.1 hypothetical protein CHH50_04980 [Terribacillus saccharophilus]PAE00843.1 hypothetical protein CHH48_05005 [Terribacillus saccharophilus]
MCRLHNERGAALVLVLWIIVLLTILGTILFSQLLTTTLQMNKQEEATLESDLSNMATLYVSTFINQKNATHDSLEETLGQLPKEIEIDNNKITLEANVNENNENEILLDITFDATDGHRREKIPIK